MVSLGWKLGGRFLEGYRTEANRFDFGSGDA